MIKGQESQCIGYDGTVRVSSNVIIQTVYGGDDLDGSRLERIRLPWLFDQYKLPEHLFTLPVVQRSLEVARKHALWRANLFKDLDTSFPCGIALGPILGQSKFTCSKQLLEAFASRVCKMHRSQHSSKNTVFNISIAAAVLQACEYLDPQDDIEPLIALYSKSLVAAGEGVGALGASCIGEPSMQMTLNVFHYSGIADKNVTITGLPRFKQLINGVDTY
jgi:hypothetical protein